MTEAFTALLGPLSPQERAVLVLRDVLGWELGDVAELLGVRIEAANCALLRAREAIGTPPHVTPRPGCSGRGTAATGPTHPSS